MVTLGSAEQSQSLEKGLFPRAVPTIAGEDVSLRPIYSLFATQYTLGTDWFDSHEADDFLNSRMIILWGWNPAHSIYGTNTPLYLALARESGCKMVVVDPQFTDSAAVYRAQWIPIRPGTDSAMMMAMAHFIIVENLQDQKFLDKFTLGFDKFKDYLLGKEDGIAKTPEWAERITGVPAETIRALAKDYATTKPAALVPAWAPQRTAYGEQYARAAITLQTMTGNIGIRGGYVGCMNFGFPLIVHIP